MAATSQLESLLQDSRRGRMEVSRPDEDSMTATSFHAAGWEAARRDSAAATLPAAAEDAGWQVSPARSACANAATPPHWQTAAAAVLSFTRKWTASAASWQLCGLLWLSMATRSSTLRCSAATEGSACAGHSGAARPWGHGNAGGEALQPPGEGWRKGVPAAEEGAVVSCGRPRLGKCFCSRRSSRARQPSTRPAMPPPAASSSSRTSASSVSAAPSAATACRGLESWLARLSRSRVAAAASLSPPSKQQTQ
mmetsp:Transcript_9698/g.27721  ORF Transcript_9698/g.27721 Transcript_9698/m.27721 type:complete len:252 (-) Transcript_9698:2660-3415(-)